MNQPVGSLYGPYQSVNSKVTLHRYFLPSLVGEGWVDAILGSDGYFAVISDYGNYAFRWTHFGERDFRQFFIGLDWDYVRRKLNHRTVLDGERTGAALRARVCMARRTKKIDAYTAREAYDRAGSVDNHVELQDWHHDYRGLVYLGDEWDNIFEKPEIDIMAFVKRALPRLQELIRYELWKESQPSGKET